MGFRGGVGPAGAFSRQCEPRTERCPPGSGSPPGGGAWSRAAPGPGRISGDGAGRQRVGPGAWLGRRMLVVEVANGCSLVWGAEAVQALRERLGVGGRTVGSLPRGPRQNSRLGLPLLLMPEEARLLAEIGAVTLVSAPRTDSRQHSLALASFKLQQEQGFQEQSALAAEARETRRQEILEKIAEGQAAKKQKLEPDLGASESQEANAGENEASVGQASREYDEAGYPSPQPGPSDGVALLPRSALLVQLATARPRPIKARPLDWRVQSKDWPHAGRPAHELRYSIYRDLWERGFFLSAAGKFGGDFLVYPGDPLRFHAHYIAQCWAPGDSIPLQDLVSAGRLGTSVKKTLLLCSPQPDGKVVYTSLQWASLQ
ncbi:tRNA-splicing endonuclease subunit Sen34 isoform X2 [Pteropus medius]|uniref:tRNA-splicing endonuclease subunit Sen34 isoform X2 n=1 Tax=Pteropus vampyrus TaxID=132908 RepID=UPI00196AEEF4|nr:tRNA-splicing endonuclease subunit Sen34 isoform X2 [Pteropus giganteus]